MINYVTLGKSNSCDEKPKGIKEKYQIDKDNLYGQLSQIILTYHIDIVFSHYMTKGNRKMMFPVLLQLRENQILFKHVSLLHMEPGVETSKSSLDFLWERILSGQSIKNNTMLLVKQILLRLAGRRCACKFVERKYRFLYESVDKLVLLSPHYIPFFSEISNRNKNKKIGSIPNALSFSRDFKFQKNDSKENVVLIVARLEEMQKRIISALEIWEKVTQDGRFQDWQLQIVGGGEDEKYYESKIKELHLRNIRLFGRQPSQSFYEKASIFIMTSAFEGFPMVLLEAQQMGCVPMVFDSFGAVYDIIEDGKNGCVIPNNNLDLYAKRLMWLMEHKEDREQMALNGIKSCQKFSPEKIAEQWKNLFEGLVKQ